MLGSSVEWERDVDGSARSGGYAIGLVIECDDGPEGGTGSEVGGEVAANGATGLCGALVDSPIPRVRPVTFGLTVPEVNEYGRLV